MQGFDLHLIKGYISICSETNSIDCIRWNTESINSTLEEQEWTATDSCCSDEFEI